MADGLEPSLTSAAGLKPGCLPAAVLLPLPCLATAVEPHPACHPIARRLQVQLKRRGDDEKYCAKVLAIGTECDIALLSGQWVEVGQLGDVAAGVGRWRAGWVDLLRTPARPILPYLPSTISLHPPPRAVDDEAFWKDIVPLELGDLPALQVCVRGRGCGGFAGAASGS